MRTISIDIESYSSIDLAKSGVYRYAESPDFEILLLGYSVDGGDVQVVDLANGENLPAEISAALVDPTIIKWAFNAQFERICLSKWLRLPPGQYLDPRSWRCTMIWSAYMGLPLSLEGVGVVLGLEKQKLSEGKDLIRYFCKPCNPTAANGERSRNLPQHAPEKWIAFKEYNRRDVETEIAIQEKLAKFSVPDNVWADYHLDQEINDRGVALDMDLVRQAKAMDNRSRTELMRLMQELTELDNPNSVLQMKQWLSDQGLETDTLGKKAVTEMLKSAPEALGKVLELRQALAKSSIKKYTAMENVVCEDDRLHGMFRFYGANRTGRWCLTGDHEILTKEGWRKIASPFNGRPEIAVFDSDSEEIRFEKSKIISFDYSGDMYLWESKRVDQLSTPEHRNLITNSHGVKKVRFVADIPSNAQLPVGGRLKPCLPPRFTEGELRLLVAYQADGISAGGARNGLAFRFSKQRKIQRIKELLTSLKYPYRENKHGDGVTCVRVPASNYNPHIKTKQFGWWLLNENADAFFDELGHWDGHIQTESSMQYVTTNRLNAEIIATFAHLSGRAAIINSRQVPEGKNWREAYYVEIWNNVSPKGVSIPDAPKLSHGYTSTVYCAETSTGFFIVRRNKKIWITGNSSTTINIQNLPQNHLSDLEQARGLVRCGNFDALEMLYDTVPEVLSELIRTAFIPKPGCKFIVADFSAIEARVIAWLAGETWRQQVFESGGDIYCASASQMFRVPVEKHGVNGHLRQKGKIAELALGYGGSVGALKAMGALEMGLDEGELQPLVSAWRASNPSIVRLWWDVDRAAMKAVRERTVSETHGIRFSYQSGILFISLPSGRQLSYVKPRIGINQFGSDCITYEGVGSTKKWERIESYGPKFTENIVQAISRDILCHAMQNLKDYSIVMHVHDEIVIEADQAITTDSICTQMGQTPPWAKGLLLRADGYETNFYRKD